MEKQNEVMAKWDFGLRQVNIRKWDLATFKIVKDKFWIYDEAHFLQNSWYSDCTCSKCKIKLGVSGITSWDKQVSKWEWIEKVVKDIF